MDELFVGEQYIIKDTSVRSNGCIVEIININQDSVFFKVIDQNTNDDPQRRAGAKSSVPNTRRGTRGFKLIAEPEPIEPVEVINPGFDTLFGG